MKFPTKKVEKIVGLKFPTNETHVSWKNGTIDQLKKLIDIGAADPEGYQNSSPMIKDFIAEFDKVANVFVQGYIILPPRSDCRFSVDGINIMNTSDVDKVFSFIKKFGSSDEFFFSKNENGTYNFSFWWD